MILGIINNHIIMTKNIHVPRAPRGMPEDELKHRQALNSRASWSSMNRDIRLGKECPAEQGLIGVKETNDKKYARRPSNDVRQATSKELSLLFEKTTSNPVLSSRRDVVLAYPEDHFEKGKVS